MHISAVLTTFFAGCALASPVIQPEMAKRTDSPESVIVGATPVATDNRLIARTTPLPTCNPNNVAIVKKQKPWSSTFCSRWRAAGTSHAAPVTVTGLSNSQISNICSCILRGTYVSNPPLSTTKTTPATGQATTYQQRVIAHHNVHRTNHSAPALSWSQSLANTAAKIASSCVYAHNLTVDGGGYGQNIAAGLPGSNVSAVITDLFYNGEVANFKNLYGQENPSMANFENWGHFTQVVWKTTTTVGCATQDCSAKGLENTGGFVAPYFTVCNYGPPGNYLGEFADGVGRPLGNPTVGWSYDL